MIKNNNKGFMLMETLLVSVFIASTLIFLFIQFQKVRDSYKTSFTYNTVTGTYAASTFLNYLQENGIENLSKTIASGTVSIDLTTCPGSYLSNTSLCKKIVSDLGINKVYYTSSDTSAFITRTSGTTELTPKFKEFIKNIKVTNRLSYRLLFEYNDETYSTILARINAVAPIPTPPPPVVYTVGTEIYYNPETNKKCTAAELNTTVEAKTGCLKWNVITMGDTTSSSSIDIMLDHNSTGHAAWILKEDYIAAGGTEAEYGVYGNNNKGPITVNKQLQVDITSWNSSIKSSARLITGQEVANIGKDTAWNEGNFTGNMYSSQPWLYQNLSSANTAEKPRGYWTSTADSSSSDRAWGMFSDGDLYGINVAIAPGCGVRPVITISKSVIS